MQKNGRQRPKRLLSIKERESQAAARGLLILFMVLALMPTVNAKEMHTNTHHDMKMCFLCA